MKCAVVVVTHNSEKHIERCIESVTELCPGAEIVVVDNASTDGTLEKLQRFGGSIIRIENEANEGFARANNMGMRVKKADAYLLLNPDAYLTSNVIAEIRSHYPGGSEIGIVGPHLVYPDGSYQTSAYSFSSPVKWVLQDLRARRIILRLRSSVAGRKLLKALKLVPLGRPFVAGLLGHAGEEGNECRESVDWVTGACMLISRSVFECTGGFDENIFMYGEDEELCFRAKKMGLRADRVKTGPVVHHCGWKESDLAERIAVRNYESLSYVVDKNYADRPLGRWLMQQILRMRYRRARRHLGRTEG